MTIDIDKQKILTTYVKNNLSQYLEFDVDKIYDVSDYAFIFGGAIRDSIVGESINDIDIVGVSNSIRAVEKLLKQEGYIYEEQYYEVNGVLSLYTDVKIIHAPITYVKGNKKIQLIRPVIKYLQDDQVKSFFKILTNVDLSCCGVYYNGKYIKESYNSAIIHCIFKKFNVDYDSLMYDDGREKIRSAKLVSRGWEKMKSNPYYNEDVVVSSFSNSDDKALDDYFKKIDRDLTIDDILD